MLLSGLAGDEDVVNVNEHKVQPNEQVIHKPLESHASIFESKWHAPELKKATRGDDHCFGDC